jgi:hypothetical protein
MFDLISSNKPMLVYAPLMCIFFFFFLMTCQNLSRHMTCHILMGDF